MFVAAFFGDSVLNYSEDTFVLCFLASKIDGLTFGMVESEGIKGAFELT